MSISYESIAYVADQKSSGTNGGASTSGSYQTREINTEIFDPDGIVTVGSNQFTLGAGTYEIEWWCPMYNQSGGAMTRLYNASQSSVIEYGDTARCPARTNAFHGIGYATVVSLDSFEIQMKAGNSRSLGWGEAQSFGTEQYTTVAIRKLSTSAAATSFATMVHELSSGTAGPAFTSGSRQTRPITAIENDPDSIITSLSSNQFVLPAGSYELICNAVADNVGDVASFLRNVTDGADTLRSVNCDGVSNEETAITLAGAFTIAGAKTFEIQGECDSTGTYGQAHSWGDERYMNILLRKLP